MASAKNPVRPARRETTEAVEDYAKAIYALQQRGTPVTINAVAERLGVTAASASGMVRKLDARGLVSHLPYKGVELTDAGDRDPFVGTPWHKHVAARLEPILTGS